MQIPAAQPVMMLYISNKRECLLPNAGMEITLRKPVPSRLWQEKHRRTDEGILILFTFTLLQSFCESLPFQELETLKETWKA